MKRSLLATAITAALAASMVAFSAGPASAGLCSGDATNAPSVRAQVDGGDFSGGGVYPHIERFVDVEPGEVRTVGAQWKNESDSTRTIRIRNLAVEKDGGLRIKVFVGGENVTNRFRNDGPGLSFKDVPAGKRTSVVEIRFRNITAMSAPEGFQALYGHYKGAASGQCVSVSAFANDEPA